MAKKEEHVGFSAEDCFAVIDTHCPTWLFLHPFTIANLSAAMIECKSKWKFLWDFRRSGSELYNDVIDAYTEASIWSPAEIKTIITTPGEPECISELANQTGSKIIQMKPKILPFTQLDLEAFNEEYEFFVDYSTFVENLFQPADLDVYKEYGIINHEGEYEDYIDSINHDIDEAVICNAAFAYKIMTQDRSILLESLLSNIAVNSILS